MPVVTKWLIEGSKATIARGGATEVVDIHFNEDIDQGGSSTIAQAFTAPGMPNINDPHPSPVFQNLTLSEMTAELVSRDKAKITARYTIPPLAFNDSIFWIESSLQTKRTNVEEGGDRIVVEDQEGNEQGHPVDTAIPNITLRWQRAEATNPIANIQTYLGKLNLGGSWGFPDKTLLCTRLDSRKRDDADGAGWLTDYAFQWNPDGWGAEVIATQGNTYVPNPVALNLRLVDVYPATSFDPLALEVPV